MGRSTGRYGPHGTSHILRQEVGLNGQTKGWLQWGVCQGIHGPRHTRTSLYSAASAGATTIETYLPPLVNDYVTIGNIPTAIQVLDVTGSSAPYTVTLKQEVPTTQAVNLPVTAVWTVDVYINGSQNMPLAGSGNNFLTTGIRFEEGLNPLVGDVIPILRGPGGLVTDRFAIRDMAGLRGPGSSSYVSIASTAAGPPSNVPFALGSLFLDPIGQVLYSCIASSIQSGGVVTTPAAWVIVGGLTPNGHATQSGSQTLVAATTSRINNLVTDFGTLSISSDVFVIPTRGVYTCKGYVEILEMEPTQLIVSFEYTPNGGSPASISETTNYVAGFQAGCLTVDDLLCNPGDTIGLYAYQNPISLDGASVDIVPDNARLSIVKASD